MGPTSRPSRQLLIGGGFWLLGNLAAGLAAVAIAEAAGWDLRATSGDGADVGRASIRIASGEPVGADVVPIWGTAIFQVPFWAALIAAPVVAARGWRSMIEHYRVTVRWRSVPWGVAAGLATQLAVVPVLYWLLFAVFGDADVGAPARALAARAQGTAGVAVFVAFVVFAAPIAEELAFRGLLLRALEAVMAPVWALVLSAVVFAAVHFQFVQFPGLLAFGLVAGVLAQRSGGLMAPIAAHMAFNAVAAASVLSG